MSSLLKKVTVLIGILMFIGMFNVNLSAQKVRLRSTVTPNCVNVGPPQQQGLNFADIYADGNIAVQGGFNCRGAFIYDITNPDAPIFAAHYNPGNTIHFVEAIVVGTRGYFGGINAGGVHIVDLTNPYNPVLLGTVDATHGNGFNTIHEIVIWGNYLVENTNGSANNKKIRFINISNPANPVFVREITVNDPNFVHAMHIRGNRMFTSGWGQFFNSGRTEIYDISNIETQAPVLLGTVVETAGASDENSDVHSSWTSEDGNYLYSCRESFDEDGDIRVWDIHDPAQPVLVKRIRTKTDLGLIALTPHNPVVVGNRLYVSWYEAGLQIFDITNPADPVRIGQYDTFPAAFAPPSAEERQARLNARPEDVVCGTGNLRSSILSPFGGAWGVYPFLGQDKIIVGDELLGLVILDTTGINAPLENQVSDFDGDRKTDFSVYTPNTGVWTIEKSSDGAHSSTQFGASADKIEAGDFDGDGKSDLAVFRPADGVWYVLGSTRGFFAAQFGASGDVPVAADYDADGKTDLAVFRPSDGVWYVQQSTLGFRATQFGISTDKPMIGDFEGDGKIDLAVWRPSNGTWYILQSSTSLLKGAQFGVSTDKPLTGDFDGDGKTDLAVYRPGEGNWYILKSQNNSLAVNRFGVASDVPIPADYDGDGKTDVAVFRAGENAWYRLNSSNGAFVARNFGQSGDVPSPTSVQP